MKQYEMGVFETGRCHQDMQSCLEYGIYTVIHE